MQEFVAIKVDDGDTKDVLETLIVVVFQSTFRLEMHQNNIFFIFLKFILTSACQNNKKKKQNNLKQKRN
jgi:hypothetical protein